MTIPVKRGPDWPRVLCPAPGCAMPAAPLAPRERVLHVSRRNLGQMQAGLARGFARIATAYRVVDTALGWTQAVGESILGEAAQVAPTLVWFQAQSEPDWLDDEIVGKLRAACAPNAVLVNWDGDQHHEPRAHQREWFVRLGRQLDASLVKNTRHPAEYAALGVVRPGYLGQGVDCDALRPGEPAPGVPPVVFVANNSTLIEGYAHRVALARGLGRRLGKRFGVYGRGWDFATHAAWCLGPVAEEALPAVYGGARAAISISIRADLPRYTSNRLLSILACGGVAVVERFADCEGLGLEDGVNCFLWEGEAGLAAAVDRALGLAPAAEARLRAAARELGLAHSWDAYMSQLLAIVDAVRADREGRPC